MDRDSSSSVSVSDESSEAGAAGDRRGGGCCSSPSTRSLVDTAGNLSRTVSDVSTSFSEQYSSVDHSGPFEPAAAMAKLIDRSPASAAASLSRLSMKPRADVLDRRSTDDGTFHSTAAAPILSLAQIDLCPVSRIWLLTRGSAWDACAEMELVKERFSKLLLGEDMSGGGKGVCTAVAISNAITNLYGMHARHGGKGAKDSEHFVFWHLHRSILTCRSIGCRSDGVRELPQVGAAAGGEEGDVEEGDGLPPLRLRLHRRVLPVHADPARWDQS